jgi:hypothetical protein
MSEKIFVLIYHRHKILDLIDLCYLLNTEEKLNSPNR